MRQARRRREPAEYCWCVWLLVKADALAMLPFRILLAAALFTGASADVVCSLVDEGALATLTCPAGQILTNFSFASFGTFAAGSSCDAGLTPAPACPTTVSVQVSRLCVGSAACAVSCDCASLPSPCGCESATPSFDLSVKRLAFPGVPCSGVPKQLGLIAVCAPALPPPAPQPAPPAAAENLLLEFMPSPVLGLDKLTPHFSWTPPAATARGASVQTAARIVVTGLGGAPPVWDSGVISSSTPLILPAAPLPLAADAPYQWTVSTADGTGTWSPPSAPARFNTGLLAPADWGGAAWLGAWRQGTLLRKDFNVTSAPTRVSVFASACQYYLLFIDGQRVGARELDVAWTRFPEFRSYATYDLDPAVLPPGPHTVGLALGQGFCGQSSGNAGNHTTQGLLRLALHAADGSLQQAVVTDTTWSAGSGPVLSDSTYFGEQYNASLEQAGWAAPGFVPPPGAPQWAPAALANDPPIPPVMSSQLMPAIERVAVVAPVSVFPVDAPGLPRWTFDFGQQVSGRVRLTLPPGTVPAGTNVTLKHAEALAHPPYANFDGSAWMGNLFWAYPVDSYISSGAGAGEVYEPAFTDHGFRYVEISFDPPLSSPPTLDTLSAVVLRTAARPQARLHFGHPLLQALSDASWWTESAALKGIPQGCAARGERTAWTGDASFASESELFDFDTAAFFTQFAGQMQVLQCSDGSIGSCVPNTDPHRDGWPATPQVCSKATVDPSWGTVYPTIVWGIWKYYGAVGVAAQHYPSLVEYNNMLEASMNASGGGGGERNLFCRYGDWNPIIATSCHITAAASYLHDLLHLSELAAALGKTGDASAYTARLAARRIEFHAAFWNSSLGLYGDGTQVAQAVALWTGVAASAGIAHNISVLLGQALLRDKITFGFIGVRYVFEALALNGNIESALRALLETEFPSYGAELFDLYEPSTSLWETWDASTHRQWLDESSRNHHYTASINTFLRKHVGGLDMPPGASAWSSINVRPYAALPVPADLAAALPHARVTAATIRGTIEVSWMRVATGLQINATLPTGTAGSVSVPKYFLNSTNVFEGGVLVYDGAFIPGVVAGLVSAVDDGDFVVFNVTSGAFTFSSEQRQNQVV